MTLTKTDATARDSTRGVAIITLAKAWFLVTGFAQPILLTHPSALGAEGYGLYGLALNVVSILNNVVVAGSIQAMSRAVTQDGARALRRGLVLHLLLGAILSGALVLFSGLLGSGLLHDPRIPSLLRIGAIVVGNYSVYAALVGGLNGQHRFVAQAGLDVTFATLRTAMIVAMAFTTLKVTGALSGFAAASSVILVIALSVSLPTLRSSPSDQTPATTSFAEFTRGYLGFFAPVLLYQLALNLVFQADLLVLKALSSRLAHQSQSELDRLAGIYKAVQNFAFLPYQLLLAVTFVVFPLVSRATFEGDREGTRRFIRAALRFSTMALGLMLSVLTGAPRAVLRLAYKPPLDQGYIALRVLSIGQGAFALTVLGTTILLAAGQARAATLLMLSMLTAVMFGDLVAISLNPQGIAAVNATSMGTAFGCVFGLCLVAAYFKRFYGEFIPLKTCARVALCTAMTALVGSMVPPVSKVLTLGVCAGLGGLYLTLINLSGELGPEERSALRRLVQR